jgi:peroxiredoxin
MMQVRAITRLFALFLLLSTSALAGEGAALIGTAAPEWRGLTWLSGGPLTLAGLRGRVVLLRFWSDACPYCEKTAPALRALDERYRARGLTVVGIHHPKPPGAVDPATVSRVANQLGFTFPVATDRDWTTVRAYGVGSTFQRFTSVSLLIDRDGRIRWVHPGGEFHAGGGAGHEACNAAFASLDAAIGKLLATGR